MAIGFLTLNTVQNGSVEVNTTGEELELVKALAQCMWMHAPEHEATPGVTGAYFDHSQDEHDDRDIGHLMLRPDSALQTKVILVCRKKDDENTCGGTIDLASFGYERKMVALEAWVKKDVE